MLSIPKKNYKKKVVKVVTKKLVISECIDTGLPNMQLIDDKPAKSGIQSCTMESL